MWNWSSRRYEFDIVHDKGTYDHWEYGAVIYEKMFRIPLLTNVNYATFIVKPQTKDDRYEISSQYKTCFFGYACCKYYLWTDKVSILNCFFLTVFSKSQMVFSREGFSSTKFQETIEYQCPIILFWLCPKELADNRNEWLHNLKKHFHKWNYSTTLQKPVPKRL